MAILEIKDNIFSQMLYSAINKDDQEKRTKEKLISVYAAKSRERVLLFSRVLRKKQFINSKLDGDINKEPLTPFSQSLFTKNVTMC